MNRIGLLALSFLFANQSPLVAEASVFPTRIQTRPEVSSTNTSKLAARTPAQEHHVAEPDIQDALDFAGPRDLRQAHSVSAHKLNDWSKPLEQLDAVLSKSNTDETSLAELKHKMRQESRSTRTSPAAESGVGAPLSKRFKEEFACHCSFQVRCQSNAFCRRKYSRAHRCVFSPCCGFFCSALGPK